MIMTGKGKGREGEGKGGEGSGKNADVGINMKENPAAISSKITQA